LGKSKSAQVWRDLICIKDQSRPALMSALGQKQSFASAEQRQWKSVHFVMLSRHAQTPFSTHLCSLDDSQ